MRAWTVRISPPVNPYPSFPTKPSTLRREPIRQAASIATRAARSSAHPTETQIDGVGQANTCLIRKQRFISVFSPGSVHFVISTRNISAVQRRAQSTQVDQEKSAGLRIETKSCVLSRYIDG